MKNHTKVYLEAFGYNKEDWIECEKCHNTAVDIHHIEPRGMGGDPTGSKDVPENLMALCRRCHNLMEEKLFTKDEQKEIHEKYIEERELYRKVRENPEKYFS